MDSAKEELTSKLTALINLEVAEEDEDALVEEILRLSPDPEILTYAFSKDFEGLTPSQIVDKAFENKPIAL